MIKVKRKKLRISLKGLTEKQVKKVIKYSKFASTTKQSIKTITEKIKTKISRFKSSNIANAKKQFYSTGLGVYKLKQKLEKQWYFYEGRIKINGKKWKDLTPKQQLAVKKANEKLWLQYLRWNAKRKALTQVKEDRQNAYQFAKESYEERVKSYKAGTHTASETWYMHRSTEESYRLNETSQLSKEQLVERLYGNDSQFLDDIAEIGYDSAIEKWLAKALKEGKIKELAQGIAYGYITEDYSEVISPP